MKPGLVKHGLVKHESRYSSPMNASEYDQLDVIVSEDPIDRGRMKISLLEGRWRTKEQTIAMLQEAIELIKQLP